MKKNILSRMISAALIMVLSFQTAPSVFATSTTLLKDQRATTDTEVLYEEDFEDYGTGKITLEKVKTKTITFIFPVERHTLRMAACI